MIVDEFLLLLLEFMIITSNCKRHTNNKFVLATSSISLGGGGVGDNFFRFFQENIWNIWKFNVNSSNFANFLKKKCEFFKNKIKLAIGNFKLSDN
jgi:hypothetical protein